jgi:hypothetical protein
MLRTESGISELPPILEIPGFDFSFSICPEVLHGFYENTASNLIDLYSAKFFPSKGDGPRDPLPWEISQKNLDKISADLRAAHGFMPATLERSPQDPFAKAEYMTGEDESTLLGMTGAIVFQEKLPDNYYKHYVKFSRLVGLATAQFVTEEEIHEIEHGMPDCVLESEQSVRSLASFSPSLYPLIH